MIELKGKDGSVFRAPIENIKAYGFDGPVTSEAKVWVVVDGREYSFTVEAAAQFKTLCEVMSQREKKITGLTA